MIVNATVVGSISNQGKEIFIFSFSRFSNETERDVECSYSKTLYIYTTKPALYFIHIIIFTSGFPSKMKWI